MAFGQKILQINQEFKDWLNETFALKSHQHPELRQNGPYIVKREHSSDKWFEIWSDGYLVQGGILDFKNDKSIRDDWRGYGTLYKEYPNTGYFVYAGLYNTLGGAGSMSVRPHTTSQFFWFYDHSGSDSIHTGTGRFWYIARGYVSQTTVDQYRN